MSEARNTPPGRTASNPNTPAGQRPQATPGVGRPPASGAPTRASNPGTMKVITASRARPPPPKSSQRWQDRLKTETINLALNAWSILKEAYQDFRRSDRYFKYKAMIIAGWVAISGVTIIASCPQHSELDARNRLGARLGPKPTDPARPAVTIFNDSDKPWKDVRIVVNEKYQAAVPQVEPHDAVTVTPKQLLGPKGMVAPADLQAYDVELRTDDGKAHLMKGGETQ